MGLELRHPSVGTSVSRIEWESAALHELAEQEVGDIVVAQDATTLARLPIGREGQVLRVVGGVPTWGSPAAEISFAIGGQSEMDMAIENITWGFELT